ncbi:acyltransferase domain-containing protein, partial [Streptomyces sp. NPDC053367]|uniref:acyltransferase domain-containing protein n=1 Tax=Streptomyces sp. NPDC053367 TaxID=3365700 RepID=UPI0037D78BE7
EVIDTSRMDAEYWFTNLRRTVRLEESVRALADSGHQLFIEVSAHPVLTAAIEETVDGVEGAATCGTLRRGEGGPQRMVLSLAEAFVRGADVDWAEVSGPGSVVDLPTYAFQRQSYWLVPDRAPQSGARNPAEEALWTAVSDGTRPR